MIACITILLYRMGEHPFKKLFLFVCLLFSFRTCDDITQRIVISHLRVELSAGGICLFGLANQFFVTLGWSRGNLVLGAALQLCGVVFAAVLGVLLFEEKLDAMTACGIGVIMLSILATAVIKSKI